MDVNSANKLDLGAYLEEERLTHEKMQVDAKETHSVLSIRRMLDQNGLSGMMVANLPITPSLNLQIDSSYSFDAVPLHPPQNFALDSKLDPKAYNFEILGLVGSAKFYYCDS